MERTIPLKFKNADGTFTVLPDDACQLVGYDYDGNEIYEGDRLFYACEIRPDAIDEPWAFCGNWSLIRNGEKVSIVVDLRGYYGEKAVLLPCSLNERSDTFDKHLEWKLVEKNGEYGGKILGDPKDINMYLIEKAKRGKSGGKIRITRTTEGEPNG